MFHVKQPRMTTDNGPAVNESFTNAEITEDHVQNVLHIDAAGEPAKCGSRRPQFFGDQLLAAVAFAVFGQGAIERGHCFRQQTAMPGTGDDARFHGRKLVLGKGAKSFN